MKKTILATILFGMLIASLMASGAFFFASGIVDEEGDINEKKATEILRGLDELPGVSVEEQDMMFSKRGVLLAQDNETITTQTEDQRWTFTYSEPVNASIGDSIRITYTYSQQGEREVRHVQSSAYQHS